MTTERSTADIEADLREEAKIMRLIAHDVAIEAADRLAKHDAELTYWIREHKEAVSEAINVNAELAAIDALRPLDESGEPVPWERLAKVFEAVWSDEPKVLHPRGPEPHHWVSAMGDYLRGIR